jgi:hypothetical protein
MSSAVATAFETLMTNQFQYFYLENRSSEPLTFTPKSSLNLVVMWAEFSVEERANPLYAADTYSLTAPMHVCGRSYTLQAHQRVSVYVSLTDRTNFSASSAQRRQLMDGRKVEVLGSLFFERQVPVRSVSSSSPSLSDRISKLIDVSATFVISYGRLTPDTYDFGVVGYDNGWRETRFDLTLENVSDVTMHAQWKVPKGLSLTCDTVIVLKPWQVVVVQAVLSPSKVCVCVYVQKNSHTHSFIQHLSFSLSTTTLRCST